MNLDQAFNLIKKASEMAPMNKESHVLVEQALKLVADFIMEHSKKEEAK